MEKMDLADLRDWAIDQEIHSDVYGFLMKYGSLGQYGIIYGNKFDWQNVSKLLNNDEVENAMGKIHSILGATGFAHFSDYLKNENTIMVDTMREGAIPDNYSTNEITSLIESLSAESKDRLKLVKDSWGSEFLESEAFGDWLKSISHTIVRFAECKIEFKFMLYNALHFEPTIMKALYKNDAFVALDNEVRAFI